MATSRKKGHFDKFEKQFQTSTLSSAYFSLSLLMITSISSMRFYSSRCYLIPSKCNGTDNFYHDYSFPKVVYKECRYKNSKNRLYIKLFDRLKFYNTVRSIQAKVCKQCFHQMIQLKLILTQVGRAFADKQKGSFFLSKFFQYSCCNLFHVQL